MQAHQTDFSSGNVYRNIIEVAVPMILAQLLNLLYNVVDRIYIGRIPEVGTTALTGVGLCFPIISLITAFTYLYGNGGASGASDGECFYFIDRNRNCVDDYRADLL